MTVRKLFQANGSANVTHMAQLEVAQVNSSPHKR